MTTVRVTRAGPRGSNGWAPELALVSDSDRRVLQVVDWVGGEGAKPASGDYIGPTGLTAVIGDAIDVRGIEGAQGWSPVLAVSIDGERRVLKVQDWTGGEGTKPAVGDYLAADGTLVSDIALAADIRGSIGVTGDKGWSAVFAIASDGARRVLQVDDWVGGDGTKPATGQYVGATGLVVAIADAVDIRGPDGPVSATGTVAGDDVVGFFDSTGTVIKSLGAVTGFEKVANKGVASGYASLDASAKVLSAELDVATQAEAEAGTDNAKVMTSLRTAQAIDAQAAGAFEGALLHVRDEKTSGTGPAGPAAGSWTTRELNTVKTNEITGASLASNQITLPAGDFYIVASAPAAGNILHKTRLQNITGAATLIDGTSESVGSASDQTRSFVIGRFTLGASSALELQHQVSATASGGRASGITGAVEVYSEVMVWKVG